MDDAVDKLDEAVKLYVTKLTRESLGERDGQRAMEIISFSINLEHVGDIIDKNLMELASKKIKRKLVFLQGGRGRVGRLSPGGARQSQTGVQRLHDRRRQNRPAA